MGCFLFRPAYFIPTCGSRDGETAPRCMQLQSVYDQTSIRVRRADSRGLARAGMFVLSGRRISDQRDDLSNAARGAEKNAFVDGGRAICAGTVFAGRDFGNRKKRQANTTMELG